MKKMCYSIMLVLSFPACVLANEIGIGFSMRDEGGMVYMPIRASVNLMVEPNLGFSASNVDINDSTVGGSSGDSRNYSVGVGLFNASSIDEMTDIYYGARLSYFRSKAAITSMSPSTSKTDGYSISPIIGFEYHIGRSVTLGAEAGFYYSKSNSEANYSSGIVFTNRGISQGTRSDIIIRYYFK